MGTRRWGWDVCESRKLDLSTCLQNDRSLSDKLVFFFHWQSGNLIWPQLHFYVVLCDIQQLIQQLLLFCKKCLSLCMINEQWKHWITLTQSFATCAIQSPLHIMSVSCCMFVFVTCHLLPVLYVCICSWMDRELVSHANPSWVRWMLPVHILFHINSLLNKLSTVYFIIRRPSYIANLDTSRIIYSYFAHFHTFIKYATIFWGNSTIMHKVYLIQKGIIKIMLIIGTKNSCRNWLIELHLVIAEL